MANDQSFDDLMSRLHAGDQEAAFRVVDRFAERLIALARSRLGNRLRQKVDPEDVLQSVYKSFFTRQAQGQFTLENWDSLWGILTVMTLRKVGRWAERFGTGKRNMSMEVPMDAGKDGAPGGWEATTAEPTPEDAAMLTEAVEGLLGQLDERDREIVILSLQGHDVAEISTRIGRTRRTVQRVLKHIKETLQSMAQDGTS